MSKIFIDSVRLSFGFEHEHITHLHGLNGSEHSASHLIHLIESKQSEVFMGSLEALGDQVGVWEDIDQNLQLRSYKNGEWNDKLAMLPSF